ncbi:MAG: hypothetical protein AAFP76_07655 [Bacteroidota bacterium]
MTRRSLIENLKSRSIFRIFYWFLKISLGLGFVISGLRKMPGVKFTQISTDNPIGLFFEGMYVTGFYWNFIGYYQIVVGILLMSPWFNRLTPLLLLPVSFNIFLVSASLQMTGTPIITLCMLLGNCFLIAWHYESYQPLFKIKA